MLSLANHRRQLNRIQTHMIEVPVSDSRGNAVAGFVASSCPASGAVSSSSI